MPDGSINNVTIDNIKCTVPFIQPDIHYDLRGPSLPCFHNIFPISITGYRVIVSRTSQSTILKSPTLVKGLPVMPMLQLTGFTISLKNRRIP